jgi:hypothetical protein
MEHKDRSEEMKSAYENNKLKAQSNRLTFDKKSLFSATFASVVSLVSFGISVITALSTFVVEDNVQIILENTGLMAVCDFSSTRSPFSMAGTDQLHF